MQVASLARSAPRSSSRAGSPTKKHQENSSDDHQRDRESRVSELESGENGGAKFPACICGCNVQGSFWPKLDVTLQQRFDYSIDLRRVAQVYGVTSRCREFSKDLLPVLLEGLPTGQVTRPLANIEYG